MTDLSIAKRAAKETKPRGPIPRPLLIQLGLLLCIVAVFWPVCRFEFLNFDDNVNVYENDRIVDFSLHNLLYFWQGPYQGLYIPLTYSLWGLLAKASLSLGLGHGHALQPVLFHIINLLLHGASATLLFHLLHRYLRQAWAAGAGALLFAIHPVQVEAVAWVTGCKDVLSGFFSILALWHYLAYAEACRAGRRDKAHYAWAALFFGAAILSKPSAVTTPLLLALLGYFLLARKARQLAVELGPWLLLSLSMVVISRGSQPGAKGIFIPNLWERLLVAGDAIAFYLGKLILPLTLAPSYGRTPESVLEHGWVYATSLIPILLATLLLWKYRRPWALAATGVFTAAILPVLGLIPFDFQLMSTVADRYLYLAMLGPALALAWGLARQQKIRPGVWLGIGALLVILGLKSALQVRHWQSSITFHSYAVEVNPQNAAAYQNLSIALREADRISEAIAAFQQAMNLNPKLISSANDLHQRAKTDVRSEEHYQQRLATNPSDAEAYFGLADLSQRDLNYTEALSYCLKGLELQPDFAIGYAKLGLIYVALNNNEKAIAAYLKAIAIDPELAEVYSNLGLVYGKKDKQQAIAMYQKALAIKPGLGEAANNLGYLYLGMQRYQEAIPLLQQAIARYPDNPLPLNNLGLAHFKLGQLPAAADCFQKAITADPSFAPALSNLSKVELQRGNIQSAIDLADQAEALGFEDPEHFDQLDNYREEVP